VVFSTLFSAGILRIALAAQPSEAEMPRSKDAVTGEDEPVLEVDTDGLVAVGGTLDPDLLEKAYSRGIFPWSSDPAITWWCPDPRAVFELDDFHAARSLRKRIRRAGWAFHIDRDFEGTMRRCAEPTGDRPSTWISEDFVLAYCELHRRKIAHSIEVYEGDQPVGGLYGVALGGFFGGESMFHRRSDASKAALVFLVQHLRSRGFVLLDAQVMNQHLRNLGARDISRTEFLRRLRRALALKVTF
jgi:leucyl/phenylalanyl-tRNA--protein transferase